MSFENDHNQKMIGEELIEQANDIVNNFEKIEKYCNNIRRKNDAMFGILCLSLICNIILFFRKPGSVT